MYTNLEKITLTADTENQKDLWIKVIEFNREQEQAIVEKPRFGKSICILSVPKSVIFVRVIKARFCLDLPFSKLF